MPESKRWFDEVRTIIESMPRAGFTLAEMYEYLPVLQAAHPENNSVADTLRRVLQELRDAGYLVFEGRGSYRRLPEPVGSSLMPTAYGLSRALTSDEKPLLDGVSADSAPLESRSGLAYVISAASSRQAVAREYELVRDFELHLLSLGRTTGRRKITLGSDRRLWTDIVDESEERLYEAKAAASRSNIRMAIGQLLDYRRHTGIAKLSVLVPDEPEPDLKQLLVEIGIGLVYRLDGRFVGLTE